MAARALGLALLAVGLHTRTARCDALQSIAHGMPEAMHQCHHATALQCTHLDGWAHLKVLAHDSLILGAREKLQALVRPGQAGHCFPAPQQRQAAALKKDIIYVVLLYPVRWYRTTSSRSTLN